MVLGRKNGVLFKTAVSLEETGKVDIVVLDKTGTITRGEPKVTDIIPGEGIAKDALVRTALALELRANIRWRKPLWFMERNRRLQ